tara:strand:- start:1820 stop:3448 length:1629 start_codon:yes stop_codon:yes gene_type:complete
MKAIKFFDKYFVLLFFITYFIIGFVIVDDFGVSIDEEFQRFSGFYWLCYVLDFLPFDQFKSEALSKLNNIGGLSLPDPRNYPFYGVVFDLPLAFIETLLGVSDSKQYFILRHQATFLIFFISSIFFFKLLKLRFQKNIIIFLGVIIYISTPRIFGDSFFNNKDLIFLSFVTITFYYYLKLVDNFNLKNIFFFSIFTSITCALRIVGVFIPISFFSIFLIKNKLDKNKIFYLLIYLSFFIIFLIFCWPYLWSSPLKNFYQAFTMFSEYDDQIVQMLFKGNYIFSNYLPISYLPTWIFITSPIISIILFLIGYLFLFKRFFIRLVGIDKNNNSNDFWRGKNEEKDFIIFLNFSLVFFYIILFSPILYTGWRHLYFLHIFLTYFCTVALYLIDIKFKKKIIFAAISLIIFVNFYEIKKFHPFQSLYFNQLIKQDKKKNFEVDYWGLAGVKFLNAILEKEKNKEEIKIAVASRIPLERSLKLLEKSKQEKIKILGQDYKNAEYIFNNNLSEVNKYKNDKYSIPKNFKKIEEYRIRGFMIYEMYKRN